MTKRIAAITFILFCTSIAWWILGATIFSRTFSSDQKLRDQVVSIWGAPHQQMPPRASYRDWITRKVESEEDGKKIVRHVRDQVSTPLPLERSRVNVALHLEHRQKGLLWYSTYKVRFGGTYAFRNPSSEEEAVTFTLTYPAKKAIYDDLTFTLDGEPLETTTRQNSIQGTTVVAPEKTVVLEVGYRSQGLDSWRYHLGAEVAQARDFKLVTTTNFKDIDFPPDTLAPTEKQETPEGWKLSWAYRNLVSGFQIGIAMPEKVQPGPLAGRISYFAPASLLFFFFVIFIISTLRNIDLHPMNYFFLACAFFSFHLLLAYLVDHIPVHLAFVICSIVSIFLVVSYLRLVVGMRFAAVEAGTAQLVYLVLFSYAFFFEGYTGLTVTIGAIVSLFVAMQLTGRIRWAEKFAGRPLPAHARPSAPTGDS